MARLPRPLRSKKVPVTQLPSLFATIPAPFRDEWEADAPWRLLGTPLDRLLLAHPERSIASPLPDGVVLVGAGIVIEEGVSIAPNVVLEGPIFLGGGSSIRPGASIRGGCWIGPGCVVGASTELKRVILFDRAKAPHLNYVGDSILGADVNLGAGTILSNFRHDGRVITIPSPTGPIETGRRKLGAVVGDGASTGCNCVLNPGVVLGARTRLYTGVQLRAGLWPADSLVKLRQELEVVGLDR